MNVLVLGQHTDNYGDDAAGIALLQRLDAFNEVKKITVLYRFKNVKPIEYVSSKIIHNTTDFPDYVVKGRLRLVTDLYNYCNNMILKSDKNNKFNMLLNEADYIFMSPCGANIGSYLDRQLLFALCTCVAKKKKVITHLNSFDDSGDKRFNWIALSMLKKCYRIYTRERRSQEYLSSKEIESLFGVDSAFMLEEPENVTTEEKKPFVVVLTEINKWHRRYKQYSWTVNEYYNRILQPILYMASEEKRKVFLVPHTDGENEFLLELKQLADNDCPGICYFKQEIENAFEYSNCIRNAYCVISARYHGVVFAAKHKVPFIGLAYDSKTAEVCEYTGCANQCVSIVDVMDGKVNIDEKVKDIIDHNADIVTQLTRFMGSETLQTVYKPTSELLNKNKYLYHHDD